MTANYVTPFRVFQSCVEFYPRLFAAIAVQNMAAAAKMIPTAAAGRMTPTDDAAISDAPQMVQDSELVAPANTTHADNPHPRKRHNSSPRKRRTDHKTVRKTFKKATGRRKAA